MKRCRNISRPTQSKSSTLPVNPKDQNGGLGSKRSRGFSKAYHHEEKEHCQNHYLGRIGLVYGHHLVPQHFHPIGSFRDLGTSGVTMSPGHLEQLPMWLALYLITPWIVFPQKMVRCPLNSGVVHPNGRKRRT